MNRSSRSARAYVTSAQRADHLPVRLHRYHWHRPLASLNAHLPSVASAYRISTTSADTTETTDFLV